MSPKNVHPLIQWAQRENCIYLTINVDHADKFDVADNSVYIKGRCGGDEIIREAKINLYGKVKTDYRKTNTDRHLEVFIEKAEPTWWPRLLESKEKTPWIKVDFNKWVDEDDEEAEGDGFDLNQYMGSYNDSDMPEMPDMGDMDSGSEEDYSEMPALSSVEESGAEKNATSEMESGTKKADDDVEKNHVSRGVESSE